MLGWGEGQGIDQIDHLPGPGRTAAAVAVSFADLMQPSAAWPWSLSRDQGFRMQGLLGHGGDAEGDGDDVRAVARAQLAEDGP